MPQLTKWAAYLEEKGLDPENQLSTDDFAGHLAHNTNLSIKAIEALGAFVQIARRRGRRRTRGPLRIDHRKQMPAQWERMALDGDHYKLAFDQPGHVESKVQPRMGRHSRSALVPEQDRGDGMGFLLEDRCSRMVCRWTIARPSPSLTGRCGQQR